MAEHFSLVIGYYSFTFKKNLDEIGAEAVLDGIYTVRTNLPEQVLGDAQNSRRLAPADLTPASMGRYRPDVFAALQCALCPCPRVAKKLRTQSNIYHCSALSETLPSDRQKKTGGAGNGGRLPRSAERAERCGSATPMNIARALIQNSMPLVGTDDPPSLETRAADILIEESINTTATDDASPGD